VFLFFSLDGLPWTWLFFRKEKEKKRHSQEGKDREANKLPMEGSWGALCALYACSLGGGLATSDAIIDISSKATTED